MRRNLFLYLTLVCFLGLVAIFIVDGYMGIYDTIYITAGEQEQKVEPDYWLRQDQFWSMGVNWGEKIFFDYKVDNRRFSSYSEEIAVSVWQSQEKIADLVSQHIQIDAFDKGKLEVVLDTAELKSADIPPERGYEFTVIVNRGETERRVIIYVNPSSLPKLPSPIR